MKRLNNKNLGFTLLEVMIAGVITTVASLGALTYYQDQLQEEQEVNASLISDDLVQAYKKFQIVNRRAPTDIAELLSSDLYTGKSVTPWNSNIGGAVSSNGKAFGFNFTAQNSAQAQRMADSLSKYNAVAVGSLVSFSTPTPTVDTIADQMLCNQAVAGSPDCNIMQIDLDVNGNDLLDINRIEATTFAIDEFSADEGQVTNLVVTNSVTIGGNTITHSGNQLEFNADNTLFTGDINLTGDLVGNNSNVTGINNLDVNTISANTAIINDATISNAQGSTLDFDEADFNSLVTQEITSQQGTFASLDTQNLTSTDVNTENFTGGQGDFSNLSANTSTGQNLTLNDRLTTTNLTASTSSLGQVSGTSANFSGLIRGGSFIGGGASFESVAVSQGVSAANFYGSDFCTSTGCVNSNTTQSTANTNAISTNASKISSNLAKINTNTSKIDTNTTTIRDNSSTISSNTTRITTNTNEANAQSSSITTLERDVASLENRWAVCVAAGGCQ